MADSDTINSIKRAFSILDLLCKNIKPMGVTELATAMDLPKVTVFRVISSLLECGAVSKDSAGKYRLGSIYFRYVEKLRTDFSLGSLAEPVLRKLRDCTHESVNLGILQQDTVINIITLSGDSFIITSKAPPLSPLYCSSSGKIFLSHKNDEEITEYFSSPLPRRTIHSIITADAFFKERQEILEKGIAFDREEYEYGLYCIGAPVYNCKSQLIAAISLSGPTSRLEYRGLNLLIDLVSSAASEITQLVQDARIMDGY